MTEWIDVEEREPELWQKVVFLVKKDNEITEWRNHKVFYTGKYQTEYYTHLGYYGKTSFQPKGFYTRASISSDDTWHWHHKARFWMPLPNNPFNGKQIN